MDSSWTGDDSDQGSFIDISSFAGSDADESYAYPTGMQSTTRADADGLLSSMTPEAGAAGPIVEALYVFGGNPPDEVSCGPGDRFVLLDSEDPEWWLVCPVGYRPEAQGYLPANYVRFVDPAAGAGGAGARIAGTAQLWSTLTGQSRRTRARPALPDPLDTTSTPAVLGAANRHFGEVLAELLERERLPPGYTVSTLAELERHRDYQLSFALGPQLGASGLDLVDLALEGEPGTLAGRDPRLSCILSLGRVRLVPAPDPNLELIKVCTRVVLYDERQFVGNVLRVSVPAAVVTYSGTNRELMSWDYSQDGVVQSYVLRTDSASRELRLIVELALTIRDPTAPGGAIEVGCGWTRLPLFKKDDHLAVNYRGHELELYGGAVCGEHTILGSIPAPEPGSSSTRQRKRRLKDQPRLHLKLGPVKKATAAAVAKLPATVLLPVAVVPVAVLYREALATTLAGGRGEGLSAAATCQPFLAAFPRAIALEHLALHTTRLWASERSKPAGRRRQNSGGAAADAAKLEALFLNKVWPLLYVSEVSAEPGLLPSADEAFRSEQLALFAQAADGIGSAEFVYEPFHTDQVAFCVA